MSFRTPLFVVDRGIPGIERAVSPYGDIRAVSAEKITRDALMDATGLIVRSVTRVDRDLLHGTSVRFVGSATAGTDHVDRAWLKRCGVRFASAPGANAESVGDYVLAALYHVAGARDESLAGRTIGIVGCGQVGNRLATRCRALGLKVMLCDPPKAERWARRSRPHPFRPLADVLSQAEIVTLHVPLVDDGRHPTVHLVDARFLEALRPDAWLVNTSRGGVVDEQALLACDRGPGALILDVWQGEPLPDRHLVARCDLATPHVAGYAIDSKTRATRAMQRAVARFLGVPSVEADGLSDGIETPAPRPVPDALADEARWVSALVGSVWDIARDDRGLRSAIGDGAAFEALRTGYPVRRLFSRCALDPARVPMAMRRAVFDGLRFARARQVR